MGNWDFARLIVTAKKALDKRQGNFAGRLYVHADSDSQAYFGRLAQDSCCGRRANIVRQVGGRTSDVLTRPENGNRHLCAQ